MKMDIIESAVEQKLHITSRKFLFNQTWEMFHKISVGRKVFLFGTGGGARYIVKQYPDMDVLDGIIDNDVEKKKHVFNDFCAEAFDTVYSDLCIYPLEYLMNYNPDDVVVLITSTKFYEEMMGQLENIGITNIFVLLLMECNNEKRREFGGCNEDFLLLRTQCVDRYCKKDIEMKKIVFSIGDYGGHGKYICRKLLEMRDDLDIVWIIKDWSETLPNGIRIVTEGNWKKYIYEMETACVWIYDVMVPGYIKKRPEQTYIQVKHWSSITLKSFYLNDSSMCGEPQIIDDIKYNARMMDYVFTGSVFDEESCRKGFGVDNIFKRIGSPRSDVLLEENIREKVYGRICLDTQLHTVLYAPTFRASEVFKRVEFRLRLDCGMLVDKCRQKFGGEWVVLLRLHPIISKYSKMWATADYIVDTSDYNDSQELVAASDVVITDYSSIMFEPAFVKKPVFLLAPDRMDYIGGERTFLIDYDTLPFPIAESNEELIQNIENFDRVEYERKLEAFMDKYGVHEDGHASERAAEFISGLIDKD